jgi:hypothetical protein
MRSVAYLVNESKRRAEMQQYLVHWQSGVDHWMVNHELKKNLPSIIFKFNFLLFREVILPHSIAAWFIRANFLKYRPTDGPEK